MFFLSFLFFSWISFSASVPEAINVPPLITVPEILTWVKGSQPKVRTVEELLQKLPEAYRAYFVLQYDSQSNHSSTPTHPRVIFFGPDAKLLLAFSGLPSDTFYNTVEMIEYEPATASHSFYSIHFQNPEPAQIEVNPQDCLRCHGSDPKPNWEPYSLWPGAFGSLHDRILPKTKEHHFFEEFLNTYQDSPRYQLLPGPFHVETEDTFGLKTYYLSNVGVSPGSSLSILLGFLNRDRIAKKLIKTEFHNRYRPAFTAALIGCEQTIDTFLPQDLKGNHPKDFNAVLAETESYLQKDFARKRRALKKYLEADEEFISDHADLFGFRSTEVERIARLRYLLTKRIKNPVNFDRWALSISKTSLDFNDGVSGLENLIGHYLMLAYEEEDPIRKRVPVKEIGFTVTYPIQTYSLTEPPRLICELLAKEARALSLVE